MHLLQIKFINPTSLLAASQQKLMTTLDFLRKGGWLMVPILLLSILAVYALVERLLALRKGAKPTQQWLANLHAQILAGDVQKAKLLCEQKNSAVARVMKVGIENLAHTPKSLETAIEAAGQAEVYQLEKNLSLLGTIAGAAPMLGFLGTVIGMIQAFMAMAQATSQVSPQLLSSGIYQAMITTAAGLVVGIIADLGYKYILTRVHTATYHIEQAASQLIELMQDTPQEHLAKQANEAQN